MIIHKKARPVVHTLPLPSPITKYFSNTEWEIDLSNNTNPYLGECSDYPDVMQTTLKELYLHTLLSIQPPSDVSEISSSLSHQNILLTVGSMEGIDLLLRTFAEPNADRVCVIQPTFPAYAHWARLHNLSVHSIDLRGEALNDISIADVQALAPRMVFVCNPNKPTGTQLDASLINTLCETLDGFVIVDEAYIEFSDSPSSLFELPHHDNLIVLRTFSKAWGLAGIRCGAIIAHPAIINALRHVQLPFGVSRFAQEKVKERLLNTTPTFHSWERIKKDREILTNQLSPLVNVANVFKSATNFIMVQFHDFNEAMRLLQKHKIHVLDCSASLPKAVRISVGWVQQNDRVVEALSTVI